VHVVVVRFELHVPHSRSLKQKRAAIKPVVEGMRNRFSLAVAEVEHQDKWQRATVAGALVSGSVSHARDVVEAAERWVWSRPDIEVSDVDARWFGWEDGDG
jgi:uncharacterized protein YlxP (DUF503 family)